MTNTVMESGSRGSTDSVFRHVMTTLVRGRWIVLGCLAVALLVAAAWLYWTDPVYEARATVIVEAGRREGGAVDMVGLGAYRDVLVEVEVLRSLDLARRVADRMYLLRESDGSGAATFPIFASGRAVATPAALAEILQERVRVEQVRREVGVVRIAFQSRVPDEARTVVDLYTEEYERRNLENSRSEATMLREFLEEQLVARQAALSESEQQIQGFQETEKAVRLDREADQLATRLADLQSLEDQAHVELTMVEAELTSLKSEAARIEPSLVGRIASGLETSIAAMQAQIAELEVEVETKYARNPALRGNEASDPEQARDVLTLAMLRRQVDGQAADYVGEVLASGGIDPAVVGRLGEGASIPGALSNISRLRTQITTKTIEASGLRARLSVIRGRLSNLGRDLERIPRQARELAGLERTRRSTETTYDWLRQRYEEARVAEQSEFGTVRVLDRAQIPSEAVAPRAAYTLTLAGMLGLLLGLLVVFVRDTFDDRIRIPEDARRFGFGMAGGLPSGSRPAGPGQDDPGFARVAGTLDLGPAGRPVRTVLVTSCRAGDGRTPLARAVAVASARSGQRTLLLHLDPTRPALHAATGTFASPGLSNVFYEGVLVREAVHSTSTPGLYELSVGNVPVDPAWFPPVKDLAALLPYLGHSFDRVVAVAAPILESGRVPAAVPLFERVLFVARAGSTRAADMEEARSLLALANAADVQVVVTQVGSPRASGGLGPAAGVTTRQPRALMRLNA